MCVAVKGSGFYDSKNYSEHDNTEHIDELITYVKTLEVILNNVTFGRDYTKLRKIICPNWIDNLNDSKDNSAIPIMSTHTIDDNILEKKLFDNSTEVSESKPKEKKNEKEDVESVPQTINKSTSKFSNIPFDKFMRNIKHSDRYEIISYEDLKTNPTDIMYVLIYNETHETWYWIYTNRLTSGKSYKFLTYRDRAAIPDNIDRLMVSYELGCTMDDTIMRMHSADFDSIRGHFSLLYDIVFTVADVE